MAKAATKYRQHKMGRAHLQKDIHKIKNALTGTSHDIQDTLNQIYSQSLKDVKKRSAAIKKNVTNYAIEKPFTTLGITFFVGLIVGFLLHRR